MLKITKTDEHVECAISLADTCFDDQGTVLLKHKCKM